jgi:hypothetical protein
MNSYFFSYEMGCMDKIFEHENWIEIMTSFYTNVGID